MTDIMVYKNSTAVGKANGIDFKEGTGVTLDVATDDKNNQTDVTINASRSRSEILIRGRGLTDQNFPEDAIGTSLSYTSGDVYLNLIGFRAGDLVTNLYVKCASVIQTITTMKMGLYDTSYNRLAVSANITTNQATGSVGPFVLTTPYTVPSEGVLYAATIIVATTPGALGIRSTAVIGVVDAIGSNPPLALKKSGLTDLDATISSPAASSGHVWVGWS